MSDDDIKIQGQLYCDVCKGQEMEVFVAGEGCHLAIRCPTCERWRMRCELLEPLGPENIKRHVGVN